MHHHALLTAAALLAATSFASPSGTAPTFGDDFQREGKDRTAKDALEGQAPPALIVDGWLNTDGAPLDWASLQGNVVVLDFWGTW